MRRSSACITSGTQEWRGAMPIFIARARMQSVEAAGWFIRVIFHDPVKHEFKKAANKSKAEAPACAKKYLVAASTARGCEF